jgi:hypothetical protein
MDAVIRGRYQPPNQTSYNIEPSNEKSTTNTTSAEGMVIIMGSIHHFQNEYGAVRQPKKDHACLHARMVVERPSYQHLFENPV